MTAAVTGVARGAAEVAVLGLSTSAGSVVDDDEPRTTSRTTDTTSVTTATAATTVVAIVCFVSYHATGVGSMSHVLASKALNAPSTGSVLVGSTCRSPSSTHCGSELFLELFLVVEHVIGVLDRVIPRGVGIPSGSAAGPHCLMLGRGWRNHVPSRTF